MKIHPLQFSVQKYNNKPQQNANYTDKKQENLMYNPLYYCDYNINFGARLNRTPANFYAQPFNKNGMPKTMIEYLNDDYEDRQNVPPAQMMKIVFEPINYADNLEEVKELFPEEPLFANLTNKPNRKARCGVLAEIELMRDENSTLFKNGKDDLGMYLLKKIYLEGKSLKEINTDFSKDVSSAYKGLSPIDYQTFSAYGIKMPNHGFWKSFLATRADFPYEYKPRKAIAHTGIQTEKLKEKTKQEMTLADIKKLPPAKGKFDNLKEWELDKLANAFVSGKGNPEETQKAIKKTSIKDSESANFVVKYMSQIMTVTLEKIHASDEMKTFWANYDSLNKSQRAKMQAYWNTTQMQALQSLAMKDTIKLFMETYGVDGNNDEFRELIDYADSIPETRKRLEKEHEIKQKEYEELFAQPEELQEPEIEQTPAVDEKIEKMQKEIGTLIETLNKISNDLGLVSVTASDITKNKDSIQISTSLQNIYEQRLDKKLEHLPMPIKNKYRSFINKHPLANDEYKLVTMFGDNEKLKDLVPDIMSKEESEKISQQIGDEFVQQNQVLYYNLVQATADTMYEINVKEPYCIHWEDNMEVIVDLFNAVPKDKIDKFQKDVTEKFNYYKTPISNSESLRITSAFINILTSMDPNQTSLQNSELLKYIILAVQYMLTTDSRVCTYYKNFINTHNTIGQLGGNTRFLLDKNASLRDKQEKIIAMLASDSTLGDLTRYTAVSNVDVLDKVVKPYSLKAYTSLLQAHYKLENQS